MSGTTLVTIGTLPGTSAATTNSLMFINQTPLGIGGDNQIDKITVGSFFDQVFGAAQGTTVFRNATSWTGLGPGSSGQFLQSNGASANLTWGSQTVIAGSSGVTATTTSGTATVSLAQVSAGNLLANTTTLSAVPSAVTPSALLDSAFGTQQGAVLYRGASTWTALAPSTSGYVLTTGGTLANPAWAPGGGVGTVTEVVASGLLTGGTITSTGTIGLPAPSTGMVASNGTSLITAVLSGATYSAGTLTVSGGGSLSITDGTHTVNPTTNLTVSGGTISGTTPNATLTISGGGSALTVTNGTTTLSTVSTIVASTGLTLAGSGSTATLTASGGGGGGAIKVTDGITTVSAAQTLTFFGASVSSTSSSTASITIGSSISPSVVQSNLSITSGALPSVTLSSAPTAGNMLVALMSHYNDSPSVQNGYTLIYNGNGITYNGTAAAYKFAAAGESATQSPFNLATTGNGLIVFEVTGYNNLPFETGVLAEQTSTTATFSAFAPSYSLALGFGFQQNGANSLSVSGLTNVGTTTSSILGTSMLISLAQQTSSAALQNIVLSQSSGPAMAGLVINVP